jgi:hypothetical protein
MGDASALEALEQLGVRGILRQLAKDGQLVEVRCEMPHCYCFRGRETADHSPTLKSRGGKLTPDNVRLAHKLCNSRDYEWCTRINEHTPQADVAGGDRRGAERAQRPDDPGTNRWTPASVLKAFVS